MATRIFENTVLIDDPNEAPITELYAFLSVDETGEGILAGNLFGQELTPLVTSKRRVAEAMRPLALEISRLSGKRVRLMRFSVSEEIGIWGPKDS